MNLRSASDFKVKTNMTLRKAYNSETDATSESDYSSGSEEGDVLGSPPNNPDPTIPEATELPPGSPARIPPGQFDKLWKILLQNGWTKACNKSGRWFYMMPGYNKTTGARVGVTYWEDGQSLLEFVNKHGGWAFVDIYRNETKKRKEEKQAGNPVKRTKSLRSVGIQSTVQSAEVGVQTSPLNLGEDQLLEGVQRLFAEKRKDIEYIRLRAKQVEAKNVLRAEALSHMEAVHLLFKEKQYHVVDLLQAKTLEETKKQLEKVQNELKIDRKELEELVSQKALLETALQTFKERIVEAMT